MPAGRAAKRVVLVKRECRLVQGLALDQRHRVKRPAIVLPEAVDRDDARVLKLGRDGCFAYETPPRFLVQLFGTNPFQRHGAIKLFLVGGDHFSQAAAGVMVLRPVYGNGAQKTGNHVTVCCAGRMHALRCGREPGGVEVEHRIQSQHGCNSPP